MITRSRASVASSAEDGWPYPDTGVEPEGDDDLDLDLIELRAGSRAFASLSVSERLALFGRFGLAGHAPQSMKHLALELGLTHSQARDLLGSAIDKVRSRLDSEPLRPGSRRRAL